MDYESAKVIGAGLAAIGVIGSGVGVGSVWSSLIATVGRNPSAKSNVELYAWIGFAVTEAIALFALVISLMILFK
ncbi:MULTISPECIES: ATP synthase subunit C [Rhodospirillaceae]|jgi:F-type H+-transporting ATPase subunit c|uniref:ATP synthase subunit c n=4 Tax=Rhodospirillaceae TaxID=41295 RepID=A0A1H6GYT0_MAGFU|nr:MULTISPECIES: ATP synthase subunit C [Magnetospirillum]EPY01773.1 H+-transporting two-sector ATPase subunit C [Magnetospirillum fulvum MGU-K5]CCG42577.1 ATP synthase subunit C, membrane-bound, F0 sector; DCCD-binding [Magnetospirillum molischianum DSM 120]SEH28697.1 ATP synthase F0 subcomplex C subunit [Magnetospirillum fulvum]